MNGTLVTFGIVNQWADCRLECVRCFVCNKRLRLLCPWCAATCRFSEPCWAYKNIYGMYRHRHCVPRTH